MADLYLDQIKTDVLEHIDPTTCEVLFSRAEFFARPPSRSHPDPRRCLRDVYEGEVKEYLYLYAPAEVVRERLAIQGYTAARMERAWERARTNYIERLIELTAQISTERLTAEIAALREITFAEWKEALELRARADFDGGPVPHEGLDLEGVLREEPFWDALAVLAIKLDALRPVAVWADLLDVYDDYQFDAKLTPHENFDIQREPYDEGDLGKILILTEGKTDQRIISAALAALYPEYAEAYQFIDFEAFRIEGGASPLARMVKQFAGVRLPARILAIFDNDAAGAEALLSLRSIHLPKNLRTMTLPDVELARRYPTQGPEGLRAMDVNGGACAIEMFLGRSCLSDQNGNLRPVRWSQWNHATGRYQGELIGKAEVTAKFMASLKGTPAALRRRFPEMRELLTAIFGAFKDEAV